MKNFLKKYQYYFYFLLILIISSGSYFIFFKKGDTSNGIIIANPGDFVQTVTVSGKVVAAKNVEIGFNRPGKVSQVLVTEGERVEAGQLIASLDAREAELALNSARLDLQKIIETSSVSQNIGLAKNYEDSLANINKTFLDLPNIIDRLEDVIDNYQTSPYKNNLPNDTARQYYNQAATSFYHGKTVYQNILVKYQNLKRPLSGSAISLMNEETYTMLQTLAQTLKDADTYINYTYDHSEQSSRTVELVNDRNNIGSWSQLVNTDLSLIGASRNTLKNSSLDVEVQKLTVDQKANDYAQYFLVAPFAGLVTRVDIKIGQIVSAGQVSAAMINDDLFQIESYVPEVSVANLKVGNPAQVTLDAYGPETFFTAKIVYIDQAETLKDGVSTYKIKLQFTTKDERIRSGMTANVIITSENKSQVIALPANAILTATSGEKYVQLKKGQMSIKQTITTGVVGSLGQTEITSGLKAGDEVILNPQSK